jgi:hypothetical protein
VVDSVLASIVSVQPFSDVGPSGRGAAFIVLGSFVLSFLLIRTSARLTRSVSWWPGGFVHGDVHVHHLVWGICLMLLAGFLSFALPPDTGWYRVVAVVFGVGAGLTMDEFALWLRLEDVYWTHQGRTSIDGMVLATSFAALVVVGTQPFGLDEPGSVAGTVLVVGGVAVLSAVCFAKGRLLLGVIGLFVPVVALVGVVRVARPSSPWARWRYRGRRAHRLRRAQERFAPDKLGARLTRGFGDLVAGRPTSVEEILHPAPRHDRGAGVAEDAAPERRRTRPGQPV